MFQRSKNTKSPAKLIEVFSALGDKTRFKLYRLLKNEKEICVSQLAEKVGITNAGVSQQLKILESAGLIERQRIGQKICYQVVDDEDLNKKIGKLVDG